METHTIHGELLLQRVRIGVVGCGGTGSAIAAGLPYLHHYVEFEVKENPRVKREGNFHRYLILRRHRSKSPTPKTWMLAG